MNSFNEFPGLLRLFSLDVKNKIVEMLNYRLLLRRTDLLNGGGLIFYVTRLVHLRALSHFSCHLVCVLVDEHLERLLFVRQGVCLKTGFTAFNHARRKKLCSIGGVANLLDRLRWWRLEFNSRIEGAGIDLKRRSSWLAGALTLFEGCRRVKALVVVLRAYFLLRGVTIHFWRTLPPLLARSGGLDLSEMEEGFRLLLLGLCLKRVAVYGGCLLVLSISKALLGLCNNFNGAPKVLLSFSLWPLHLLNLMSVLNLASARDTLLSSVTSGRPH